MSISSWESNEQPIPGSRWHGMSNQTWKTDQHTTPKKQTDGGINGANAGVVRDVEASSRGTSRSTHMNTLSNQPPTETRRSSWSPIRVTKVRQGEQVGEEIKQRQLRASWPPRSLHCRDRAARAKIRGSKKSGEGSYTEEGASFFLSEDERERAWCT